jgi:molybdenum cofactor synthesis domain-containing protein
MKRPERQPGKSGKPAPRPVPERATRPRVEIVSVGRELLRGRIADLNAQHLAGFFSSRGAIVSRITVVDDNARAISGVLREALDRAPHLVVTSGGLGPAEEDRTLDAVADALGRPRSANRPAKDMVDAAYARLHGGKRNKKSATTGRTAARERLYSLPVGTDPIANPIGVSPGVMCRLPGGTTLVCLPGMPDEMRAVLEEAAAELRLVGPRGLAHREIESPTSDEAALTPLLDRLIGEFPDVWINSRPAGSRNTGARIVISIEAAGSDEAEANAAVDGVVKRLLALAAGSP